MKKNVCRIGCVPNISTDIYLVGTCRENRYCSAELDDDYAGVDIFINNKKVTSLETDGFITILEKDDLCDFFKQYEDVGFDISVMAGGISIIHVVGNIDSPELRFLDKEGNNLLDKNTDTEDYIAHNFDDGINFQLHLNAVSFNEINMSNFDTKTCDIKEYKLDNTSSPQPTVPKDSIELSPEKFDKLIDKLKAGGAEVIISDEKFDLDSLNQTKEVKKPLDLSLIPDRIKISQLLSNSTEGFNLTENGSVLNLFVEEEASNLTVLDIDIDLSDKFNVLYLFRFKSIEFNTKQHKDITHITVDSKILNLDNLNIDSVYMLEQRFPLETVNDALVILSKFKNLKNSKFYVNNLDFEQMYEFYETKPKNSFIFHPDPENVINRLSNQYKHDKNIDNLLLKLNQIIVFGE